MTTYIRNMDPVKDFSPLARLFTVEMEDPTTEEALREDYQQHRDRILCLRIATSEYGEIKGFNWLTRDRLDDKRANFYVVVSREHRQQGIGSLPYDEVERISRTLAIHELRANFPDTLPQSHDFAEHRGFSLISHSIGMQLELGQLDFQPYVHLREDLRKQGFEFTSMEALGN